MDRIRGIFERPLPARGRHQMFTHHPHVLANEAPHRPEYLGPWCLHDILLYERRRAPVLAASGNGSQR